MDILNSAARTANLMVLSKAGKDPSLSGMGTTMTACTISGGKCYIIHIGDSRAYIAKGGVLTQLTYDHSYVNEMVRAGKMTPEEAKGHPRRNVLTRVLGFSEEMSADGYVHDVESNSVVLLCSDGLYNMVPDKKINKIATSSSEPAKKLVDTANKNGGKDNISVVIIRIGAQ